MIVKEKEEVPQWYVDREDFGNLVWSEKQSKSKWMREVFIQLKNSVNTDS